MSFLPQTTLNELKKTITELTAHGKGILAADESTATVTKRFDALNIPCNENTRSDYRYLLFSAPEIENYIAGIILYEETLMQKTKEGMPFSDYLKQKGIVPGIKVDKGLIHLPFTKEENTTQGLDGLADRLANYKKSGARFAKWRAVYAISSNTPSTLAIQTNAENLARYAAICQEAGIIPIVEPEVLIDGDHTLELCFAVSEKVLAAVFHSLHMHKVLLEYMILKPSMVIPGKNCKERATAEHIAKATLTVLSRTVPPAVPSINFLSGGQSPEEASLNLNLINQHKHKMPWNLSFSYARALQEPAMKAWSGKTENTKKAQEKFIERAKANSLASLGKLTALEVQ